MKDRHRQTRRTFVKKSLAAGIVAAQPSLLSGILKAQGGGTTGTGTTDPWATTDPWQTTALPTTTFYSTTSLLQGMLCVWPLVETQSFQDQWFANNQMFNVIVTSVTRKKDSPGTPPYTNDTPVWAVNAAIYPVNSTSSIAVRERTRYMRFECQYPTITSMETDAQGLVLPPAMQGVEDTVSTPPGGGSPIFNIPGSNVSYGFQLTTEIGGLGSNEVTLSWGLEIVTGNQVVWSGASDKNLKYSP